MNNNEEKTLIELQNLQRQLGKKQSFEEAVAGIISILRNSYISSSPSLRRKKYQRRVKARRQLEGIPWTQPLEDSEEMSREVRKQLEGNPWRQPWEKMSPAIYEAVRRVATVLRTRHTAPGFWLAGLLLFEEAETLFTTSSEKEYLKSCIEQARGQLHELENPPPVHPENNQRFLFEGHLTVGPEPPPPAWLVAQNVLTTLAASQDWNAVTESSRSEQDGNDNSTDGSRVPELVQHLIDNAPQLNFENLERVIEASLQEIGAGPQRTPPASKEVVANLPTVIVTPEIIARLGQDTQCAVCRENLVLNDSMQELPCGHLFHPLCLKPWLDEHNSCPICRHELRTDDHEYESRKEREKEAEEERKGAENALPGGEYMYV